MFESEQVKAYKSITAPEELKKRVMTACAAPKNSGKTIYRYSTIAACLAVIIALSLVFGTMGGGAVISFDGQNLGERGVPVLTAVSAMSRSASGIVLEVELNGKTEIKTEDGAVYNAESGEILDGEIDGKVMIIWDVVPTDTEKIYVLTFENSRGATKVTLLFNEAAGWILCCDK